MERVLWLFSIGKVEKSTWSKPIKGVARRRLRICIRACLYQIFIPRSRRKGVISIDLYAELFRDFPICFCVMQPCWLYGHILLYDRTKKIAITFLYIIRIFSILICYAKLILVSLLLPTIQTCFGVQESVIQVIHAIFIWLYLCRSCCGCSN